MQGAIRTGLAAVWLVGAAWIGVAEKAEAVPAEENAARDYYRAMELWKEMAEKPEGQLLVGFSGEERIGLELAEALRKAEAVLKEVDKGTEKARCQWEIDRSKGPVTELSYLGSMRMLARAAGVRARYSFQEGRRRDGLKQTLAIMRMGRHIGQTDGVIIEHLVGISIQSLARKILMDHFSQLTEADLRFLEEQWEKLPRGATAGSAIRAESQQFMGWLMRILEEGRAEEVLAEREASMTVEDPTVELLERMVEEPEIVRKEIAETQACMAELAEVMDGPWEQFNEVAKQIEERMRKKAEEIRQKSSLPEEGIQATVYGLIPAYTQLYYTDARHRVDEAMIRAAIAYRRGGLEKLREIRDPITNRPFEVRKVSEKSFELIWRPPWEAKEPVKKLFR